MLCCKEHKVNSVHTVVWLVQRRSLAEIYQHSYTLEMKATLSPEKMVNLYHCTWHHMLQASVLI